MTKTRAMLRYPAVSDQHVAFVHGGDLWVIEKGKALEGGAATRLTSALGRETRPRFSPNGEYLAFSGNYGGSVDIYVIPTVGGVPERLTHHPARDHVVDWIRPWGDEPSSILYASGMESPFPSAHQQLFCISPEGGLPLKLPLTSAAFGSVSPGGMLAFQELDSTAIPRRRIRGGGAPQIYLFDLAAPNAKPMRLTGGFEPEAGNSNFHPLWTWDGERLFFLSNRKSRTLGLWYFEKIDQALLASGNFPEPRPFFSCDNAPIQFPAMGPEEIVFEKEGVLYLHRLDSRCPQRLEIEVPGDRRQRMTQTKRVAREIQSWGFSPQGKCVAFEARGHLFTTPVGVGPVRQLTSGSGSAHRTPSWSPDGQWIAYFTDRSGEYQLALRRSDGRGDEKILTTAADFPRGFRYRPFWSPNSKKLAVIDHLRHIHVCELSGGPNTFKTHLQRADTDISWIIYASPRDFRISWSPCSRYITYARKRRNFHDSIYLWDIKEEKQSVLTSGYYPDRDPVFDPGGEYIFLQTIREFLPTSDFEAGTWAFTDQALCFSRC